MVNTKTRKRGRAANIEQERVEELVHELPNKKVPLEDSLVALRKYLLRYDLRSHSPMTFHGYLLQGRVGRYTSSGRKTNRSPYSAAFTIANDHLRAGVIKESEAIAEFLYAVENKDNELKMPFGYSENGNHDEAVE